MGEHHPIRLRGLDQGCMRLLRDGYLVLENALPRPTLSALDQDLARDFEETPFCTGGFYGGRTKRFGRLLARSAHSDRLVRHPLVLAIAETVLAPWCERIQLNLTQAIAIHPGAPPQLPHRDQDMWRGPTGEIEYLVNVMWPLTPFTTENGATCLWPESHGARAGLVGPEDQDSRPIELDPGSALLFLGSTLHGAGGNRSAGVRRGIIISYCLGWLKPYENQWLAYPPALARTFPRPLSELVGYAQHRPNLGNFEGQCPSVLFEGDRDRPRGAIDALRPDQAEQVADFVASQASER
jgi:ectoine hydroxylase-related dioxygenase (phytanoyl-CoA dioxygenase family)